LKARPPRAGAHRELISRLLDARSETPGAQEALDRHFRDHPDDRVVAADLDRLWDDIGRVPAPALRLAPARHAPRVSWSDRLRASLVWTLPTAAALGAAALVFLPSQVAPPAPMGQQLASGDQTRKLRLADGSTVTLAARSVLEVALSPERRDLRLRSGEAFFQVAHDKARPFVVSTAHGETMAVGTAFDVRLDAAEAVVTVTEGTVRVAAPEDTQTRLVHRGEQVRYRPDGQDGLTTIGATARVDDGKAIDWTTGILRFEGTRLADVIDTVNRHSGQRIVLSDAKLAAMPIHAILKVGEVDGLVALVATQAGLSPAAARAALRVDRTG